MRRRPLLRVTALALLSIAGIVGMLLTDGIGDALFLALAASPLVVGLVRLRREERR